MKPILATLPEFETVGCKAKSAPEIRQRNFVAEFSFEFVESGFEK